MNDPEVLVIGGGVTGVGVARDAALRGLSTMLVEAGELGSGTTGRFHGQLHSGARYAVRDPGSARECASEAAIIRRIAASYIEDTGGLFVLLRGDDPAYPDQYLEGCRAAGIAVEEVAPAAVLAQEPAVTRAVIRAFVVADASFDARALARGCAASAASAGARIVTGTAVKGLRVEGGRVVGASLPDGTILTAAVVVNAAGAWAGRVAALAGCHVPVRLSKGVMVAAPGRFVGSVVSRCRLPSDGDILVPLGNSTIIGTTDAATHDPADHGADEDAVRRMRAAGDELVPGFSSAGSWRAWAAVRPLVDLAGRDEGGRDEGRQVSRSHRIIDHAAADGVPGLITVTGGKATTFRLMAEEAVDAACAALASPRPCRTATEEILPVA